MCVCVFNSNNTNCLEHSFIIMYLFKLIETSLCFIAFFNIFFYVPFYKYLFYISVIY